MLKVDQNRRKITRGSAPDEIPLMLTDERVEPLADLFFGLEPRALEILEGDGIDLPGHRRRADLSGFASLHDLTDLGSHELSAVAPELAERSRQRRRREEKKTDRLRRQYLRTDPCRLEAQ